MGRSCDRWFAMGRSLEEHVGMFGYTRSAVIKNLGLDNASIRARGSGWLVGLDFTSTITGCFTRSVESVGSSSDGWFTGGIVGVAYGASISDCYSVASVKSGTWFRGGLVGCAYGSGGVSTSITNSYSTGLINDGNTAGNVGGMVGKDYDLTVVGSFGTRTHPGRRTAQEEPVRPRARCRRRVCTRTQAGQRTSGIWLMAAIRPLILPSLRIMPRRGWC